MKQTAETRDPTPTEIKKETRHYFYSCPSLDLWSVGNSKEEAERRLREEIEILLSRCLKYAASNKPRWDGDDQTVEMKPC
jgi:predicted RNase H-like HicB family nuclease